ncbi:GPI transamidase component PIG-S-like [Tropilaelaps mercedesae]|uniref:GPI transamidase component PIG-S-like n=1 Tax=Tropilaelaps mercedesae TaxID=418985 RepID=A0A1V9Y064_9ACAR|nr:GPI transamidase component PIG-S-like [Tropilaelaps mercedesae]
MATSSEQQVDCGCSKSKYGQNDGFTVVATISYILFFVVAGLPLWWKTTEVYRAAIPFEQIENFHSSNVSQLIHVALYVDDEQLDLDALSAALVEANSVRQANLNAKSEFLMFGYSWSVQRTVKGMQDVIANSKSLSALDESFRSATADLTADLVVVLSRQFPAHPRRIIGAYRTVYVRSDEPDPKQTARHLVTTVVYNVVREDVLRGVFAPLSDIERKRVSVRGRENGGFAHSSSFGLSRLAGQFSLERYSRGRKEQPTKEQQRALHASPIVDVVLSCIVPEPQHANVLWNSKDGYESYMRPVVAKLQHVVQLQVKSQFKFGHGVNLAVEKDAALGGFRISHNALSLLINQLEKVLPGQVSLNPTLNFFVYIVPPSISPLHIYDEQGEILESNAFISPRWGGVLFYNVGYNTSKTEQPVEPIDVLLDNRIIFQVFLSQLRPLLGIPARNSEFDSHFRRDGPVVADWEVDLLMRRRTHDYLVAASRTLHSLAQLLTTIENMVINDNVGQLTETSVTSGKRALRSLAQGHLGSALASAETAFATAERAFFDPSLLGLLYFPDDQKYAIYVPLFVPTMLPVLLSLVSIVKYARTAFGIRKTKTE